MWPVYTQISLCTALEFKVYTLLANRLGSGQIMQMLKLIWVCPDLLCIFHKREGGGGYVLMAI